MEAKQSSEAETQTITVPGWDGVVQCEVLSADAPHKLSYAWRGGSAPFGIDTVLTLTLTPHEILTNLD
jgi:uncharacterized protein YndB with AHSA1/START domain